MCGPCFSLRGVGSPLRPVSPTLRPVGSGLRAGGGAGSGAGGPNDQVFNDEINEPMTTVQTLPVSVWRGENTHPGALNFYPIFIPLFEAKVSGVSVQNML